eukprot:15911-Heterococcus_DN1.PRE.1
MALSNRLLRSSRSKPSRALRGKNILPVRTRGNIRCSITVAPSNAVVSVSHYISDASCVKRAV